MKDEEAEDEILDWESTELLVSFDNHFIKLSCLMSCKSLVLLRMHVVVLILSLSNIRTLNFKHSGNLL